MIVVLKCVNMLAGLRYVYLFKHKQVFDAGKFWNDRLKELAAKLGITKPILFLKSAIAEIPMTAGYFKPVILFPAAALTNLPIENIEAILLHELAHIRRNDYLVNMMQILIEIIFFFNPALLWLSSLIKEERENCCDDIALHQTKNKKQFIYALAAFKDQEVFMQQAVLFSGAKHHLLNRLKRIITNNNKTLNTMEKTLLSAGIIITAFAALAFTKIKQPLFTNANHLIQQVKSDFFINKKDTTEPAKVNNDESKTVINNSVNGKHYKLIETDGKTELYVNGIKVPDNKIADYKGLIAKLKHQMTINKKTQDEAIKAQDEALADQANALSANDVAMENQLNALNGTLEELNAYKGDSVNQNIEKQKEAIEQRIEDLKQHDDVKQDEMKNIPSAQQKKALKAEAIALQQQAVAMEAAMKNQSAQIQKAELDKQMEQLKIEPKKLVEQSEIMKQQQLQMKAEMDKQAEIMWQQQIQMKTDLEKQNQQLNKQQELMIKQLNHQRDSLNTTKPVKPNK